MPSPTLKVGMRVKDNDPRRGGRVMKVEMIALQPKPRGALAWLVDGHAILRCTKCGDVRKRDLV